MALAEARLNSPDADFWLQRQGNIRQVGRPTRSFSKEHIGITILDRSAIFPDYLYYWFLNIYARGYWEPFTYGSVRLKHIRVEDVRQLLSRLTPEDSA